MVYLEVKHTVAEYAKWRVGFDDNESARRAAGATGVKQVYRGVEDPNAITIIMEWDKAENAQRFFADPSLREVMAAAGVTSAPEATFLTRT
jgi:hypothetical protein